MVVKRIKYFKNSHCVSMLCNMRSKLIPTDHIYIHKYRNFFIFRYVSQPPHVLKKFVDCMSYTIMLK